MSDSDIYVTGTNSMNFVKLGMSIMLLETFFFKFFLSGTNFSKLIAD